MNNLLGDLRAAFGLTACYWMVYRRKDGSYGVIPESKLTPNHHLRDRVLRGYYGISAREAIRRQKLIDSKR